LNQRVRPEVAGPMTGSVKPIALLRRRFRKAMGFAALYPSYKLPFIGDAS